MDASLRRLVDESQIMGVVNRYALCMDHGEWDAVRACFADDVEVDFRAAGRKEIFRGTADAWVLDVRRTVEGMDVAQHMLSNPVHEINGDRATTRCEFYLIDIFNNSGGDNRFESGGFYDFELVRTNDRWQIVKYSAAVIWRKGNPHIFKLAHARSAKNGH